MYFPVHAAHPGVVINSIPFCFQKCPRLEDKLYGHGSNSRRESQVPSAFPMEKYDQNMVVIKIFHVNILLVWEVVNLLERIWFNKHCFCKACVKRKETEK